MAEEGENGPVLPDGGAADGANADPVAGSSFHLQAPKPLVCTTESIPYVWKEWQEKNGTVHGISALGQNREVQSETTEVPTWACRASDLCNNNNNNTTVLV